ncbi:Protein transport protein sec16 [Pleurotus pulmonarius]
MTTVEAAASLFGSDDSTPDPFASLGAPEEIDNGNASTTNSDYWLESSSANSLPPPNLPSTAGVAGTHGSSQTSYSTPTTNGGINYYDENYSQGQGWQDTQVNGTGYGGQQADAWSSAPAPNPYDPYAPYANGSAVAAAVPSTQPSHSYDPYAPPPHAGSGSVVQSTPNSSAHPYDPYAPVQASAGPTASQPFVEPASHMYDVYAPTQATSASYTAAPTHSYTPYTPAASTAGVATTTTSQYDAPYQPPAHTSYPTASTSEPPSIPAPPPPKAPLVRPKVVNAYDPPFPTTTKPARRTSSRPALNAYPATNTHSHIQQPSYEAQYSTNGSPAVVHETPSAYQAPVAHPEAFFDSVSGLPAQHPLETTHMHDPGLPSVSHDHAVFGHTSPSMGHQGLSTSPPAHHYSPSLGHNVAAPRTASPNIPQNHSRRASQDISPPKRAFTPSSNDSRSIQKPGSPVISRAFSPSSVPRTASPAPFNHVASPEFQPAAYDPYAPSKHSVNGNGHAPAYQPSTYSPPQPLVTSPNLSDARNRAMSNGSVYSFQGKEDPYAPAKLDRRQTLPISEPPYGSPQLNEPSQYGYTPTSAYTSFVSGEQELLIKPNQSAYAPSPSLMGSNDPLGRTSARVPIFSFGFGGKVVTCFHGADSLNTGFDVALAARNSTGIQIRVLKNLVSQSALNASSASFPGPLFSDPGTPTTSLVRTGASSQTKNKKARLVKYLEERAEELTQGLSYVHAGTTEGRREEGKLTLVNLLKVMIENDGKLSGTPQIDSAVRLALIPHLENSVGAAAETPVPMVGLGLSVVPDVHSETPLSTTVLRSSALDTIQDFLIRGERKKAYHYALDEKLWAHALVIASGIDKESWKEAVNEFLKVELTSKAVNGAAPSMHTSSRQPNHGREALRVAYSLFSGQGAAAVQELHPHTLLSQGKPTLTLPQLTQLTPTPLTPNFSSPIPTTPIPSDTLASWPETIAMMLTNPLTPEISAALTALGDQLAANQWIEAAHVCYLLAPQTSPIGGVGNPSARVVLLGSRSPQTWPGFTRDSDPIIFSEILEFALSLVTPAKGQEPFNGFPHLQAYRFMRAMSLAELGHVQEANRYCEAITASLTRGSPYFTPIFVEQLKGLMDRLIGAPNLDKTGSWIGSKLSKPSLDSIGGWLEGRFTKLVTGDTDPGSPVAEPKADSQPFGPFSHYSTISSATQSARSSPQPSLHAYPVGLPNTNGHNHIDRASSAMDYIRRKPSPVPRIASASATATTFAQAPSFGQSYQSPYSPNGVPSPEQEMATPRPTGDDHEEAGQEVGWWGASSYGQSTSNQTPTASSFMKVDAPVTESADGFISLMDTPSYGTPSPTYSSGSGKPQSYAPTDDDDDLGLGNSASKKKDAKGQDAQSSSAPAPPAEQPKRPDPQPNEGQTGSWFSLSRLWKKSDAPGPIKANLGEETSFYYDPETKRWVNKKAGAESAPKPAAPPPPPSRAQTASPGRTSNFAMGGNAAPPPPPRAASAIDLSTSPPSKTVMRVRSNLAPPPTAESAPSTPTGMRLSPNGGPPPPRPKSQATKRNIRSRYVDVFSAEGAN